MEYSEIVRKPPICKSQQWRSITFNRVTGMSSRASLPSTLCRSALPTPLLAAHCLIPLRTTASLTSFSRCFNPSKLRARTLPLLAYVQRASHNMTFTWLSKHTTREWTLITWGSGGSHWLLTRRIPSLLVRRKRRLPLPYEFGVHDFSSGSPPYGLCEEPCTVD